MSPSAGLYNGAPGVDGLSASRGLHYGDGVFRTLLFLDGVLHDWERQIDKLAADGRVLALEAPNPALLREEADVLLSGHERAILKILLWRRETGRGYRPATCAVDRLLLRYQAPSYPPAFWSEGVQAVSSPVRLGRQPHLAGIKHLNRLEQVLASRDWPDEVQEALMFTLDVEPLCGTRTNLFWLFGGCLYTPALDACGVAGMMRQRVLEIAAGLGIPVRIGAWSAASLKQADEAFLTNSLVGIWPLKALDSHRWPAPGKLTDTLMRSLAHPQLTGPH